MLPTLQVGGIRTVRAKRHELASQMVEDCRLARAKLLERPRFVMSSNGSVIALYHSSPDFRATVNSADIIDADGMPLVLTSRLLCRSPLSERVATTDFIHDAADAAVAAGLRFYFLGGRDGIAAEAARKLCTQHPGLHIVGTRHGYFGDDDLPEICAEIMRLKTDVLWLGLGSPRQERYALEFQKHLPGVGWIRTCGGLFDHYLGTSRRAPQWMQSAGLEWAFRMLREPLRLGRRYLTTNLPAAYHLATKTRD